MRDYVVVSSGFPDLFKELTQIFKANEQVEVIMVEKAKESSLLMNYDQKMKNSNIFKENT